MDSGHAGCSGRLAVKKSKWPLRLGLGLGPAEFRVEFEMFIDVYIYFDVHWLRTLLLVRLPSGGW